jgi:hypothetical protein
MTSFVVAATSPKNGTSNFWRRFRKPVTGLSRPAHFPQEQASATIARFRSTPCCQPVIQYGGGNMRVRFAYGNASKRDKRGVTSALCRSGVLMPPCSTFRLVHPCRKPGDSVTSPAPPGLVAFESLLSGTELREARGASRGNAVPGAKTRFPSACASGFQALGFFAGQVFMVSRSESNSGKPEARAEGMCFWVHKTRCPSACASGFKARAFLPGAGQAAASKRAARQKVVRCSFDCSVKCMPNRVGSVSLLSVTQPSVLSGKLEGHARRRSRGSIRADWGPFRG